MGRHLIASILALTLAAAAACGGQLTLWTTDPWRSDFPRGARPPASGSVKRIVLHAARREHEPAALMITNAAPGAKTAHVRVRLAPAVPKPDERALPLGNVVLRQALHLRTRSGRLVADALPRLPESELLTIPAGETRQLWIDARTHGLDAGTHVCRLEVGAEQSVELRLHAWDFALPERLPIAVFTWDYRLKGTRGPLRRQLLDELVSHGVNVFHISGSPKVVCDDEGNLTRPPDFSPWNELIELERAHGTFLFETWQFRGRPFESTSGKAIAYLSSAWRRAFAQWLKAFVTWTQERGLTYADWAFYPFDEYIGPQFVGLAQAIRRVDPKVRIFTDRLTKAEEVKAAAPYADIWCPVDGSFGERFHESLAIVRGTGKPVWFYFCGWGQKAFPPLARYRLMGWKAWHHGLQGCTYWNVFGWVGDEWDDFDGPHPDAATVYRGRDGPIPSRRWEAFREGLEDYLYVYLLGRELEKAGRDAAAGAREVLAKASGEVLAEPDDSATLYAWRRRIAEAILKLRGAAR